MGSQVGGWYTESPTVTLATQNSTDTIFYSTEGEFWKKYSIPFTPEQEGIVTLAYRATAANGNLEGTQYEVIKINAEGNFAKTATVKNAAFSMFSIL
jgi:hypothetical protein